jgi:hypothetical protein
MLDRWRGRALLLAEAGVWDGERHWPGFDAWCAAHAGQACRLWLSSAWLHELVCADDLPLRDDAAALEWARGVLQHYHGDAALAWPLAAWRQGRRRGVTALHGQSLDALRSTASASKVKLRAVMPWWSCVLRRALRVRPSLRRGAARLLVVEGQRLAVMDLKGGSIMQLQVRQLDGALGAALQPWCEEGRSAMAAGYGLVGAAPAGIVTLDGLNGMAPQAGWT